VSYPCCVRKATLYDRGICVDALCQASCVNKVCETCPCTSSHELARVMHCSDLLWSCGCVHTIPGQVAGMQLLNGFRMHSCPGILLGLPPTSDNLASLLATGGPGQELPRDWAEPRPPGKQLCQGRTGNTAPRQLRVTGLWSLVCTPPMSPSPVKTPLAKLMPLRNRHCCSRCIASIRRPNPGMPLLHGISRSPASNLGLQCWLPTWAASPTCIICRSTGPSSGGPAGREARAAQCGRGGSACAAGTHLNM
jgi:hypothetical protein